MTIKAIDTGFKRLLLREPQTYGIGEEANFPYESDTHEGHIHGTRRVTELQNERVKVEASVCAHLVGLSQPLYTTEVHEMPASFLNDPGYRYIGEDQRKRLVYTPSKERLG